MFPAEIRYTQRMEGMIKVAVAIICPLVIEPYRYLNVTK
jgi:hypothetical protein